MIRNLANVLNSQFRSYLHHQHGQSTSLLLRNFSAAVSEPTPPAPQSPSPAVVTNSVQPESLDKLYSKVELEVKCADPEILKSYSYFVTTAANHLSIDVGKCWAQRKSNKDRLILLKSVHIYKKHRVQYEIRTYFRFMNFHKLTGSTLSTFLEYIERNLPEGVAMKVTKTEIQPLPEHLTKPPE